MVQSYRIVGPFITHFTINTFITSSTHFHIKTIFPGIPDSHNKDRITSSLFYLYNGKPYRWVNARKNVTPLLTNWSHVFLASTHQYTGKLLSLYWNGPQGAESMDLFFLSWFYFSVYDVATSHINVSSLIFIKHVLLYLHKGPNSI